MEKSQEISWYETIRGKSEEAGGKISHWDGAAHKIFGYETILATNGQLHPLMLEHLTNG